MAHSYRPRAKGQKNPALLTLVNPGKPKRKPSRKPKAAAKAAKTTGWKRDRLGRIEKRLESLTQAVAGRKTKPGAQERAAIAEARLMRRKVQRMEDIPLKAPPYPFGSAPAVGAYVQGVAGRTPTGKHRGAPGWHAVQGYRTSTGRKVPSHWQYWRNPLATSGAGGKKVAKRRSRKTARRARRAWALVANRRKARKPRRKTARRTTVRRARKVVRRARKTVRRSTRRRTAKRNMFAPKRRRRVARRRGKANRRRYRSNPFGGRVGQSAKNFLAMFKPVLAAGVGLIAGRAIGNWLATTTNPTISGNQTVRENAHLIGSAAAFVGLYFFGTKIPKLGPAYVVPMTVGAGISLVDALLARFAPAEAQQYIAAPAPAPVALPAEGGTQGFGYDAYERALSGGSRFQGSEAIAEYIPGTMGEYVTREQLGYDGGEDLGGSYSRSRRMLGAFDLTEA